MIIIPTTELIGGLTDVIPTILDPKDNPLAGVLIEWDGESLHFTTYDVQAGATVEWTPGEGAEGSIDGADDTVEDIDWGGDDAPWRAWIWLESAKEIVKLFKLPAKLWRYPVTLKCSATGDRLILERTDGICAERLLTIPADRAMPARIPDVHSVAIRADGYAERRGGVQFFHQRLGAFGNVRAHGVLTMAFGGDDDPVGIAIGSRFSGFLYPSGAKNVRPYSALRDSAGMVTSNG